MIFKCKACEIKDQQIEDLKSRSHMPDETLQKWVNDLQKQIVYLQNELDKKNREIKRMMDMILIRNGAAPVSDESNPKVADQIDPMAAFASMFEEVKDANTR